ncbi:MAG: hypothetical protein AAGG75_22775 [Bacteroidota bacterium]
MKNHVLKFVYTALMFLIPLISNPFEVAAQDDVPLIINLSYSIQFVESSGVTIESQVFNGYIDFTVTNDKSDTVDTIILQDTIILRGEVAGNSSRTFRVYTTTPGLMYHCQVSDSFGASMASRWAVSK